MRLWHYELISYLPDSQLKAQWRELNSIFKNQPKHILINYVYEYPSSDLSLYANMVINEMKKRNIKIKSMDNYYTYFLTHPIPMFQNEIEMMEAIKDEVDFNEIRLHPFRGYHNDRYLLQCYFNLQEKCDRGQKDFSDEQMIKLIDFIGDRLKLDLDVIDR